MMRFLHKDQSMFPVNNGAVVQWFITSARLHLTQSELTLRAGSNHVRGVTEIYDGENI